MTTQDLILLLLPRFIPLVVVELMIRRTEPKNRSAALISTRNITAILSRSRSWPPSHHSLNKTTKIKSH
jgi:hypothetical protein